MKHRRLAWALSLFLLLPAWENANARDSIALRDLSLGMSVADIPTKEYINLTCAAKESVKLSSWNDFRACPADEMSLHGISFHFNDEVNQLAAVSDKYAGTKLAGHPVLLKGLVDSSGTLRGIRIDTDPSARLFWRKKAYLLALSVRARYGEAGWICRELASREDENPVGGLLIKEHCEKRSERRHLILVRELYRRADQPVSDFVNATHLIIKETTDP
ncbi:hypothetical protein [Bradyrhizobium glycinis]|uniref:hypothetical protein n=1 Tax=Bradyrhizobium glycinis TaxID=2751812 RepID=UPI0018D84C75|nr:hypothetical protein [Bradyrhizobium glycinis]MBH5371036.1 hypothetical protein [Bradyrhizobium glycinis]